jgi:glucosyl-3-phosphoglycerate phosphatase
LTGNSSNDGGLTEAVQQAGAVELLLIRHGESEGNVAATEAREAGVEVIEVPARDADVDLSATGRDQAKALGIALARTAEEFRPDAVVSSPYARARQTAGIAVETAGWPLQVRTDERLRDRELGILDLLTRHGIAVLHPEEAERRRHLGKFYHRPPGGESWADVALRLRSFLGDQLPGSRAGGLVVAHDAVVMLMLYVLLGLDEHQLLDFAASHTVLNASVTHLTRKQSCWELVDFSDISHLQVEGAPVTVHPGSPDVEPG